VLAAEQFVDRDAERLALDVVQRDIDGRLGGGEEGCMLLGRNTSETTTCGVSIAHCTISRSEYDTNHSTMERRSIIMKLALGAIAP